MRLKDDRGKESVVEADVLLVAIGRQGNVENIGLETVGIKTEDNHIPVDAMMRTNVAKYLCDRRRQRSANACSHRHAHGRHSRRAHCRSRSYPLDILNSPS